MQGPLTEVCQLRQLYVRIWHGEQMSLQTPAKGVQWWCWCEIRWQTVPDLGTSNRKGSVANGGPVGLRLDEAAMAERRARRLGKSATRTNGPRYDGAQPWRTSYVTYGHFKLDALRNAQPTYRLISASDTWSERRKPKISRAAAFKTDCRRRDR